MADVDADAVMNKILQDIQQEVPKIDVSIKNYLSVLIANGQKEHLLPTSQKSTSLVVDNLGCLPPHFLMDYAKLLLQCLQSSTPMDYTTFCETYPQQEGQSASQRLDEMCRYKAYITYRQHVVTSGAKVSKHFGKSYFHVTRTWPTIKEQFLLRIENGHSKTLTLGEGQKFIDMYEQAIFSSTGNFLDSFLICLYSFFN